MSPVSNKTDVVGLKDLKRVTIFLHFDWSKKKCPCKSEQIFNSSEEEEEGEENKKTKDSTFILTTEEGDENDEEDEDEDEYENDSNEIYNPFSRNDWPKSKWTEYDIFRLVFGKKFTKKIS